MLGSWSDGARQFWRVRTSEKGYINNELFYYWGKMFLAFLHQLNINNEHHVLLMDGHGSHVYNIDDMLQNNIHVVLYDAHMMHATQSMDQYPFESFKTTYNSELMKWCEKNEAKCLPHSQFYHIFNNAYDKAMTKKNIQAAFRVTGIYPINPEAILDEHFILQKFLERCSCK